MLSFAMALIFAVQPGFAQKENGKRSFFLKIVASVASHVINSREVESSHIVDKAMYGKGAIRPVTIYSQEFSDALSRLLIEWMVFEEAKVFSVASVSEAEIQKTMQEVRQKISNPQVFTKWKTYSISDSEFKDMITRKLRANKFIKYKSNSSYVQVSDEEAREYFNKNRLKFGTMEFEKFRENIKTYLARTNAQNRLRDWFEILRKKHNVKNLLLES